jgi:uncharacterized membrane protein YeaQ/YmgE (transglycosylase-associated protein family)
MGWTPPLHGIGGTIFVAFIGALVLLVVLRAIRRITYSPPRDRV